ncbi:VOC family protein [Burkholderia sp. Ac-20353]|uniref:VOC family protein n=1 Tax=Burkholderia sp. Ac-20353 TaxID=2703894 RepID=UPI00197C3455|nr:VOC family protein [Burkholderia sp. Ac-20353]MBN3789079.1 VOC family protein [Burkholderia sp. Ac-20353]
MKILDVLVPTVPAGAARALDFYRDVLDLPVTSDFESAQLGFRVTVMRPMIILDSRDEAALQIPRSVHGIYVVDDLDAYWNRVQAHVDVIVAPEHVPTGRRFIVRHPDEKVFEYLQLNS